MAWTKEQLAAISTYDKNLLVAAAAGSGKTSVLVERLIRRVLDETQDFQIDQALVVTFTNAAAAEMRQRIGAAIAEELKKRPSPRLERQLVLLNAASISTLHAFCQTVIRQNFHLLDLDPKFRLANPQEADLLKRDVLETLFEEKYADGDAGFLTFVDHYGNERGDEELYEIVLSLYEFAQSQPDPNHWIGRLPEKFDAPENATLDETQWAELLKGRLGLLFAECRQETAALLENASAAGFDFYAPVLAGDLEIFDGLLEKLPGAWDELGKTVRAVKFASMRAPKETDEELKAQFSKRRARIKEEFKAMKEAYFVSDGAQFLADLREVRPMMETICQLTADFSAAFSAAKKAKAIVDFSDLEHFCLQILKDGDGLSPSPAAKALQKKYKEIMVDEYQDVNDVQEAILTLVRSPRPNLFLVGDVKQSVYRFRLAEPELFLEKYRAYPNSGETFARIDLARNFRSRANVLAAINFLFARTMTPDVTELAYGEAERLNPGPDYPEAGRSTVAGPVELHLLDRAASGDDASGNEDLRGFALEAQYAASRIRAMMEEGAAVFDKEKKQYRPLAYRDIVVLLRSVRHKADILLEALRANDIPAYASADAGYFQETEIRVMLALLSVVDNPRQDIPLASALHSPIFGFSAESLAQIRLHCPQEDLFAALCGAAEDTADLPAEIRAASSAFLAKLTAWRNLARRRSVPDLVWQIYRDTGYYDYVGAMPGGALRQANLRMLYDRARQYETTNFRGLFRFLRFIERMRGMGTDLSVARTLGENEDVVRIMSIHKSKGLEFPVAFVCDLGKQFNMQDTSSALLIHKKLGLGPFVTSVDPNLRYPTIARRAIAQRLIQESKAEELRVLYVALTRAREKLVLIGSVKDLKASAAVWLRNSGAPEAPLPDYVVAGAKSYLDWICPALARHPDAAALRAYGDFAGETGAFSDDASRWRIETPPASAVAPPKKRADDETGWIEALKNGEPLPPSEEAEWVNKTLGWQYPSRGLGGVPAKLSVTEMKRRFELIDEMSAPLQSVQKISARPRFLQAKTKMTGAEYGTLMHSVMQHIDLRAGLAPDGIKRQLEAFARNEIILPEHLELIDVRGVCDFFQSEIGQRMQNSPNVRREMPFSVMLEAKRFYPEVQDKSERIFVQGIVDALFDEADGMVLVDYKTDRDKSAAEIAERYRLQLDIYAEAIEKILQKKVKEKYLYLFFRGGLVKL